MFTLEAFLLSDRERESECMWEIAVEPTGLVSHWQRDLVLSGLSALWKQLIQVKHPLSPVLLWQTEEHSRTDLWKFCLILKYPQKLVRTLKTLQAQEILTLQGLLDSSWRQVQSVNVSIHFEDKQRKSLLIKDHTGDEKHDAIKTFCTLEL